MSGIDLWDRLQGEIAGPMDPISKEFLRESPVDWSVSKHRALRAALMNGDEDAVVEVVRDVAGLVGRERAVWWMFAVWGNLAEQLMREEAKESGCEDFL